MAKNPILVRGLMPTCVVVSIVPKTYRERNLLIARTGFCPLFRLSGHYAGRSVVNRRAEWARVQQGGGRGGAGWHSSGRKIHSQLLEG